MASIEKRYSKSGALSYRAKVRIRGAPTTSFTFKRLSDARRWAQQTEAAIRERRHFRTAESEKHTVSDLIARFCDEELPKRPKVASLFRSQLEWWNSRIGHLILADVTPASIVEQREWLSLHGKGRGGRMSPATVNRYLAVLSVAFSTAEKEWGWIERSPLGRVKKLREPPPRVRYLDDTERSRLLEACRNSSNEFLYPIVVLALSTGARKSELLNLRWRQVDPRRELIELHDTKNRERRSLPLKGHARDLVESLGKVPRLDTDLLFPSGRNPSRPMEIRDPWIKALRRAEIQDFRFHDLRHSAASYLAMNGASLAEIAEILGHKTLQMVKRYAHLSDEHTGKVVAAMNQKIFGGEDESSQAQASS